MVKVIRQGVYYMEGRLVKEAQAFMTSDKKEVAVRNTIVSGILSSHSTGMGETLQLKPDAILLSDRTDVLRTLDFIGLKQFPLPTYLLEGRDDGAFCRSAAKKWGGADVPDRIGAASSFALEQLARSGQLLFDTGNAVCGALGAMSLWTEEGDLLRTLTRGRTEVPRRETVAVYLKGKLRKGVGPTDVALAVRQALERAGDYAEGKYLEFFGAGVSALSMDCRTVIDSSLSVACEASVWATDDKTREYLEDHLRGDGYKPLSPVQPAYYDGAVIVDLSDVEPMIGTVGGIVTVREFIEHPSEPYEKDGRAFLSGAVVGASHATYETMAEMAEILKDKQIGSGMGCSWLQYSGSVTLALAENGFLGALMRAGADFNDVFGIGDGIAQDADLGWQQTVLLDGRTIAATLANGGCLTSALGLEYSKRIKKYRFDPAPSSRRMLDCIGKPQKGAALAYDEVILPLPAFPPLPESAELSVNGTDGATAVVIGDPDDYFWSEAVSDRENGALAALSASFPDKLRRHLIDWGILPLVYEKFEFKEGDVLRLNHIAELVKAGEERIVARVVGKRRTKDIVLTLGTLTEEERGILLAGGKNNLVRGK